MTMPENEIIIIALSVSLVWVWRRTYKTCKLQVYGRSAKNSVAEMIDGEIERVYLDKTDSSERKILSVGVGRAPDNRSVMSVVVVSGRRERMGTN